MTVSFVFDDAETRSMSAALSETWRAEHACGTLVRQLAETAVSAAGPCLAFARQPLNRLSGYPRLEWAL
jgi:hypothetical protein